MSQEFESQQRLAAHTLAPVDASTGTEYYSNSMEHLLAELEWIDLLLRAQVQRARESQGDDDEFRGLYISEEEVDTLLAQPLGAPRWATTGTSFTVKSIEAAVAHLREEMTRRKM